MHISSIPSGQFHSHAIVVGGSIAGLVAARVLTRYFDLVTIVDRDRFPEEPIFRPGVPQSRQIHVLLMSGQRALEDLFPGLQQALGAAGAPSMDWTADCRWFAMGKWAPRYASGLVTRFASRDLLEWTMRRFLAEDPHVRFLDGTKVIGLAGEDGRITGVRLRGQETKPGRDDDPVFRADLVIDASGRESQLPQWLEELGYVRPQETMVNAFLGYASRVYARPENVRADWKGLLVVATPPESTRGGAIFPIEGDRWMVNLGGGGRDYPPTDQAGFLEFAHSLPNSTLYDAVEAAEPLSLIYGYRRTANRLRHYERIPNWPDGLAAIGDAVCAFNPVYGQGMTVAAQGALALDECMNEQRRLRPDGDLSGLGRRFQKRLAHAIAVPWSMAVGVDSMYPGVEGASPRLLARLSNAYMTGVIYEALDNPSVHLRYFQVIHLLEPPAALLRPAVASRALVRLARQSVQRAPQTPGTYAKLSTQRRGRGPGLEQLLRKGFRWKS